MYSWLKGFYHVMNSKYSITLDQHLHVLRDIDYLILKDISVTSPPIGGILYLNMSHPRGFFHIMYLCSLVYVVSYINCFVF